MFRVDGLGLRVLGFWGLGLEVYGGLGLGFCRFSSSTA